MALALNTTARNPGVSFRNRGVGYSCTTHLFQQLSDAASQHLNEIETQVMLRGGMVLFREDEPANRLFVVCEGQLKLSSTSPDGHVMILRLVGPGDILGLSAALNRSEYELTAETLKPTILKCVSRGDFIEFLGSYVEVGEQTSRALAKKCGEARRDTRRIGLPGSAAGRLARLLLDWSATTDCRSRESTFTMILTHEEIGNMAGLSRETVTRTLKQFERVGMISRNKTAFVICDSSRLKRLAG